MCCCFQITVLWGSRCSGMSFELRKLEDVCDILDHMRIPITSRDRKEGPYPYYGANGIQDYIDDYIFDDELVLLAEDGGNFGSKEKPIAYRISGKTWVNNHAHVLKPKNIIDVDYLCYSLMYYDVSGLVNGATRQKLTQSEMRKINIRYRSLEKQRQMVFEIKLISNIISSREHQLSNLNLLVKSRFIEMFGDPITNDKELPVEPLGKHIELLGGFAFKSTGFAKEGIPVLRIGNINSGYFKSDNLPFWKYDKALDRYLLYPGDLAISLTGTVGKDDYGNICRLGNDYPRYYLNQRNAKLILKDTVLPEFIRTLLKNKKVKDKIVNTGVGIRQANISNKSILELEVPIPNLAEQKQFASLVTQVDKSKFVVTAKFQ